MQSLHKARKKPSLPPPKCLNLSQSHLHHPPSSQPEVPLKRSQKVKLHLKLCQLTNNNYLYLFLYAFVALISCQLLIKHNNNKENGNTDNQWSKSDINNNYNRWTLSFVQVASAAETYILRDHQRYLINNNNINKSSLIRHQDNLAAAASTTTITTNTNHQRQTTKVNKQQAVSAGVAAIGHLQSTNGATRRTSGKASLVVQNQLSQQQFDLDLSNGNGNGNGNGGLQISITPRNGQIRVPVGENTILKCLISSQMNKFTRKFDVHWSRYMYDENVYEQLESSTGFEDRIGINRDNLNGDDAQNTTANQDINTSSSSSSAPANSNDNLIEQPFNRQQQLRDFLARSRQETNPISDLLIEATLSISPVKASDNATYYCKAIDGMGTSSYGDQQQDRARIDLVALSKPVVKLERVQPARDSKSAQVHWLILSDGNTPIKRTILMVRNESLHQHHHHQQQLQQQQPSPAVTQQESLDGQQQQQQTQTGYPSSSSVNVVVDSDNNQWQRIDIPGDGEFPVMGRGDSGSNYLQTGEADLASGSLLPEDNVVRADVDVTSLGGGGSSSSSGSSGSGNSDYSSSSRRRPPANWGHQNYRFPTGFQQYGSMSAGGRQRRSFNLTSLLPGVTYNLRLAAINDMGQSNWTHLSATMPNEIPAQIGEIFLLSRSNDSLAIGWKRPAYDGAKTIRYEMQLFDLNRTLTLDANTNITTTSSSSSSTSGGGSGGGAGSSQARTNFMYIFVNLNPGTDYHFHVRACSKAGCSAFSNPKILASTMDGESDEPVDVELNCQLDNHNNNNNNHNHHHQSSSSSSQQAGNVSISWLPPINTRGQLTNYSVQLESYARYLNQSGEWQVDEWRSIMETPNNHTLSLEMGGLLMPNTNYSVRVCANNRSKHCGRLSPLSSRTQCQTPPELPQQLPANLGLSLTKLSSIDRQALLASQPDSMSSEILETFVLDLPTISRRNGSIDCIQVILIRLPESFNPDDSKQDNMSSRVLEQFLPREPSDIRLVPYAKLQQQQLSSVAGNSDESGENKMKDGQKAPKRGQQQQAIDSNERALAYLAEEISGDNDNAQQQQQQLNKAQSSKMIILGDGQSQSCQKLLHAAPEELRPFDGGLKPLTYYTGFIRLLMIKHNNQNKKTELVAKYSSYFEPIRSGKLVIEIPMPRDESMVLEDKEYSLLNSFNFSQSTSSMANFQEFASRLGASLRSSAIKLYHNGSSFIASNFKLEAVSNYIMNSSPMMQLLQVGVIVLGLSLFLLLVIYLISLPGSMIRKRKRKLKRQLQKHQELANVAANNSLQAQPASNVINEPEEIHSGGYQQQQQQQQIANGYNASQLGSVVVSGASEGLQATNCYQQHPVVQAIDDNLDIQPQQQHQTTIGYGTTSSRNHTTQDCPIHSSPMNRNNINNNSNNNNISDIQTASVSRRPSVHVCHPTMRDGADGSYAANNLQSNYRTADLNHHAHHHHHHHHPQQPQRLIDSSQQVVSYATNQDHYLMARQTSDQYERNCRTTSRRHQVNGVVSTNDFNGSAYDTSGFSTSGVQMAASNARGGNFTLNHHNSVLALAKKINKSIPITLFGQIFECRLRNNWLREEYEQLPRQQFIHMDNNNNNTNEAKNLLLLKLRPQLIVSRNDTVSALISGNDLFDASLIKGSSSGQPALSANLTNNNNNNGTVTASNNGDNKRIICAKSPLDADSVWDFWRLVYEQEVSTIVMLTQTEDQQTGEIRCAQYWPTCDNEETTILSPCNEYVQKSTILPAKFKIRQETLEGELESNGINDTFKIRRLTFMVMATKPGENEPINGDGDTQQSGKPEQGDDGATKEGGKDLTEEDGGQNQSDLKDAANDEPDDEDELIIVERTILHLQYFYWNTSSLANQMRLIKFIEMANERHSRGHQIIDGQQILGKQEFNSPGSTNNSLEPIGTMLVHCSNGLGRSGLFTAMSFIIDELCAKLSQYNSQQQHQTDEFHQLPVPKLNIYQLVSRLRSQREMLLSPYRLYELLYQLTLNCIPSTIQGYNNTNYHHHHQHHHHQQQQQQQQQQHLLQNQHSHHKHQQQYQ